jgi:phage N-6-adenine-methyltransferase
VTLAGFKSRNHPQQTGARGALDEVDDRGTHPDYFDPWNERFGGFTLDVAAAPHNAKCERFYTRADDGLTQSWQGSGERIWCNPPYSDLGAWVSKAWSEWRSFARPALIVMLLPANRVEQKWWQEQIEPFRDREGSPLHVEFLPGRMRFIRPGVEIGPKGDRPPFGCCLVIWGDPHPQPWQLSASTTPEEH